MPILYVENVPTALYETLRRRAKQRRTSMGALVIEMLRDELPTPARLAARRAAHARLLALSRLPAPGPGPFPTAEEMIREDRNR